MKKLFIPFAFALALTNANAQSALPLSIEVDWNSPEVVFPESPFQHQILFVGNTDYVQVNGGDAVLAKQNHDFIGLTPITDEERTNDNQIGWISVNHERRDINPAIGDGGGMTTFLLSRNPDTEELYVEDQTLEDGRSGTFFNVDFSETGETHTNCGGITSPVDGRIWTSEEYVQSREYLETFITDMSDYTIENSGITMADGLTIPKEDNFNWMVEIDPRQSKAIRKQYNWGKQSFEGGALSIDNKTVYLGEDGTPSSFSKFVADTPGDFTEGTLYVYKQEAEDGWVEIDNTSLDNMIGYWDAIDEVGYTMFNRIEWSVIDQTTGKVYFTETGRDNPGSRLVSGNANGGIIANHHVERANAQGTTPYADDYTDYYGRIMCYDPATNDLSIYLSGGNYYEESPSADDYPSIHLSNPDALNIFTVNNKQYMIICEDLNGKSNGRVPAGNDAKTCEMFILDLDIENPTIDDLLRVAVMPVGAEVTGCIGTPDGKTILANVQHPSSGNPAPYNNSLTFAITGFDKEGAIESLKVNQVDSLEEGDFGVYPNPVQDILHFNQITDAAMYNAEGKRVKVIRDAVSMNVESLDAGVYFLLTADGEQKKVVIK